MTRKPNLENVTLVSERISNRSEDQIYQGELQYLNVAIPELIQYKVALMDGDLNQKAKQVLQIGVKHLQSGKASPDFLNFVINAISNTINGSESSLDSAFRLKNKSARPSIDPLQNPVYRRYIKTRLDFDHVLLEQEKIAKDAEERFAKFLAYPGAMSEDEACEFMDKIIHDIESCKKNRAQTVVLAKKVAMEEAYKTRWGATPKEHLANNGDPDTIRERKKTIRKFLKKHNLA